MNQTRSRGQLASWADPDGKRRRAVARRREREELEDRLAFLLDRRPHDDPEVTDLIAKLREVL